MSLNKNIIENKIDKTKIKFRKNQIIFPILMYFFLKSHRVVILKFRNFLFLKKIIINIGQIPFVHKLFNFLLFLLKNI
jgi:hypothetical protein